MRDPEKSKYMVANIKVEKRILIWAFREKKKKEEQKKKKQEVGLARAVLGDLGLRWNRC